MATAKRTPPTGLSPRFIESLRPGDSPFDVGDRGAHRGLRLRVTPKGAKVFRWVLNSDGRVITIGPWAFEPQPGHVTLREARDWLDKLKSARRGGTLDVVVAELQTSLAPASPLALAPAP